MSESLGSLLKEVVKEMTGEEPTIEATEEYGEEKWRVKTSRWSVICHGNWIDFVETAKTRKIFHEIVEKLKECEVKEGAVFEGDLISVVEELAGEEVKEWEHAEEHGYRCWRIKTSKWSLIVFDAGNGWSVPLFVETEETSELLSKVIERLEGRLAATCLG